jgi:hypothetical protein
MFSCRVSGEDAKSIDAAALEGLGQLVAGADDAETAMSRLVRATLVILGFGYVASFAANLTSQGSATAQRGVPGVEPINAWTCPLTHPIKGNFTTYSGEPCIHHVPSGEFYDKTKPERCYATEQEARAGGCRRSKR